MITDPLSASLTQDLRLAGPVQLQLWIDTDAPDADYTGKLCVVDGTTVINIAEGIYRATAELRAHTPGVPVKLDLDLRDVAVLVRAGQQLRLEVTGGSFPAYDINPQSGVSATKAKPRDFAPALHRVLHARATPSALTLWAIG